MIGHAEAISG